MNDTSYRQFLRAVRDENAATDFTDTPHRLTIYRNNWAGAVLRTMEMVYPVTRQLVGGAFFARMVRAFRLTHLPHSTNLDYYGADFAAFLEGFEPVSTLPYLPDVARLEWMHHTSSIAPHAESITLGDIAHIAPERYMELYLHPHPSLQLLRSEWPIYDIWHMHQDGETLRPILLEDKTLGHVLTLRPERSTRAERIGGEAYHFLNSLCGKTDLYQAYTLTSEAYPDFDLAQVLQTGLSQGWFSGFHIAK